MLDKDKVRVQFSRHAHEYDQHALLQKEVGASLLKHVSGSPTRILDLGCGTGTLTIALAERFPHAEIYGLDLAPGMITEALNKAIDAGCEQINFSVGDMEYPPYPEESFDLIVSNVSFQWANHIPDMFKKICAQLRPKGVFLFTLFGEKSLQELRTSAKHALQKKYIHEQTFVASKDIRTALTSADFLIHDIHTDTYERYYDSLKQLLFSMKNIGAQNAVEPHPERLITRHDLQEIEAYYKKHFSVEQKLKATYEIIVGHAACKIK